jgi:hypothetical protein
MGYGDREFRHGLRNVRNSLMLAMKAYEISNDDERIELLDMIMHTTDEVIALLDRELSGDVPSPLPD